jgi:hypothetical protein
MNLLAAIISALTLTMLTASRCDASLGGIEATVEADRLAANASMRTQRSVRFTMHELQAPSGTTMREYVSPAGVVFGVAWDGPSMPDLRQLLGDHYERYTAALASRRTRRSPVVVDLPGLVVHSSGHMRAFAGTAYLSEALPQGVSPQEIQ